MQILNACFDIGINYHFIYNPLSYIIFIILLKYPIILLYVGDPIYHGSYSIDILVSIMIIL